MYTCRTCCDRGGRGKVRSSVDVLCAGPDASSTGSWRPSLRWRPAFDRPRPFVCLPPHLGSDPSCMRRRAAGGGAARRRRRARRQAGSQKPLHSTLRQHSALQVLRTAVLYCLYSSTGRTVIQLAPYYSRTVDHIHTVASCWVLGVDHITKSYGAAPQQNRFILPSR
jgi:hypothetical protein